MYEIILIDDGSTDRSSEICLNFLEKRENEFPLITYVLQKNSGLSVARNTSVKISRGQIIAFIDQDAMAIKDWLLNIANKFETSTIPQIIGGPVLLLNKNSKFASLLYDSMFSHYMKNKHSVIGTNMAFTKTLLNGKNPFHPSFARRGDETYIFNKLKPNLTPEQISSAVVYHETPASLNAWLKTRYESGYYKALLQIINAKHIDAKKNLSLIITNKLLFLIIPIIIIMSLIMKLHILLYLGVFSYFLITFRRYLATGYLKDLTKHFWNTSKAKAVVKLCLVPIILFLVLFGYCCDDFGYLYKMVSILTTKEYAKSKTFEEPIIINKIVNIIYE